MVELFPSREVVMMIGDWQIRWYGVMYVVAFWLAWWWLPRLAKSRNLNFSKEDWAYIVTLGAAGVLVGGRLGYAVFYMPAFFAAHPGQIIALWNGGMSSHGGFMGVAVALWYAARRLKIDPLALADVVVVPVALGLALGRVGNFINQELYPGYWALLVAAADVVIGFMCWQCLRRHDVKTGQG